MHSPFAPVARPAPEPDFIYSMVKSGADVNPDEVELAHAAAVEVMVLWDSNVLHVSHLAPPRSFAVGEETGGKAAVDYFLPSEMLGTTRALVVASRDGVAVLVILPRTHGYVDIPAHGRVSLADLVASGRAQPSPEMSGAFELELPAGAKARMTLDGTALVFQISAVKAGRRLPGGFLSTMEPAALSFTGLSFLAHFGVLAVFAFFMPGLRPDDSEAADRDQILMMQRLLNAQAAREHDDPRPDDTQPGPTASQGGTGAQSRGESGAMGSTVSHEHAHVYAVAGPKENTDPHLARQAALDAAAKSGIIGILASMSLGDPDAPTSTWGREDTSGADERSARGNMFGDSIGDAAGANGLGLTGGGEGGGGHSDSIGLGEFGPLGRGAGNGPGQGVGVGVGRPGGAHHPRAPSVREGVPNVNGHIPAEVIQRIVRQNFGRFRLCYQNGMHGNPDLQGRVSVKFVIDRTGSVSLMADGGSDLPDQGVVQCVVRGFGNLSFPPPDGGMVTVVYPIVFNPGE